jgi:hypothetical protein
MLDFLPEDILLFIITLVATNSLKDLFSVKQTSQLLKKISNNEKVIQSCGLRDVSLVNKSKNGIEGRQSFYTLLEQNNNSEFCFRMGLLNIRYQVPNLERARHLLNISFQVDHIGAKYALAMLNIFSGDLETHKLGTIMLTDLWKLKVLFKCRNMIVAAKSMDQYWTLLRSWPTNLVFSKVCIREPGKKTCIGPRLRKDKWIAYCDEDYCFNTCINCRLDIEVVWFVSKIIRYGTLERLEQMPGQE